MTNFDFNSFDDLINQGTTEELEEFKHNLEIVINEHKGQELEDTKKQLSLIEAELESRKK